MAVYGVTESELAAFLRIDDAEEDAHLTDVLAAAKEAVDSFCGWTFDTAASATKVYAARWCDKLDVDPITAITALAVDTNGDGTFNQTWASTDYQLEPLNPEFSYYTIRAIESKTFPVSTRATVQVTGTFGWATVPGSVKLAVKMHAGRLHQRRNMPAALISSEDGGVTRTSMGIDGDVAALLRPFAKQAMWAA